MYFLKFTAVTAFRMCFLIATMLSSCTDHIEPGTTVPSEEIEEVGNIKVPDQVSPSSPNGIEWVAVYYAKGVQKYKAQLKNPTKPVIYEWVFVAPEADLYDKTNQKIGTHFAGPSWKKNGTDDLILGQAYSPAKTIGNGADNIDLLLLQTKPGTTPTGIFADIDYIQRLLTKGGKAPATPPTDLSQTADVPYSAVYVFSKDKP